MAETTQETGSRHRLNFHGVGRSRVVTYPAPPEEPRSEDYAVAIDGEPVDVLTARVCDPPNDHLDHGGTYSFVLFSFAGHVTLTVRSLDPFRLQSLPVSEGGTGGPPIYGMTEGVLMQSARIRPESRGIRHMLIDEKATEIRLDEPCKIVLEPRGRHKPLVILALPLEENVPDPDDPDVLYYGPGLHRPEGDVIRVESNQTLYLAGGAVVQAAVLVEDAENVTIRGRGILCGNRFPWRGGPTRWFVGLYDSNNITVEGIVIRGACCWTLVPVNCDHVDIRDVSILGGRTWNDDGIEPVNSRHVTVRDCFVRSDDDCFIANGLVDGAGGTEDILVEHTVLWCDRARVVLLGHHFRTPHVRRVTMRDIDVLHCVQKVFLLEPDDGGALEDVLFEDWRIHSEGEMLLAVVRPTINQYSIDKVSGSMRGITFKDIRVFGNPGACQIVVEGCDEEHPAEDVVFENLTIGGERVTADSPHVVVGNYVKNIAFR